MKTAPGIILRDDTSKNIYPMATEASGHNEVYVGRIRRDDSVPFGINMWVVADKYQKGMQLQILFKLLKHL